MKPLFCAVIGVVMLGGCALGPAWGWKRTDGQSVRNDPTLHAQFEQARSACIAEMRETGLSGATSNGAGAGAELQTMHRHAAMDAVRDCMARQGYTTVPIAVAEQSSEK